MDEITDDPAAHYRGLSSGLPQNLKLFHCGTHIIAGPDPLGEDGLAGTHIAQDLVFWDNSIATIIARAGCLSAPIRGVTGLTR